MRVLYLAHRIPDAPTKGDKIRSYHQIRALSERHEVHVFCLDDEPETPKTPSWREAVAACHVVPLYTGAARWRTVGALLSGRSLSAAHFAVPTLQRALAEALHGTTFDVAVVYSGAMDPLLAGFHPRVLDLVDVDSAKFQDYHRQRTVRGPKRMLFGVEGQRLANLERTAAADADLTLVCTEAEARTLRGFAAPRRLEVLGNGVDVEAFSFGAQAPRAPTQILFVGALDYQANVDAVQYLVRELLPRIQARVPNASVALVGRQPTDAVRALAGPHVALHANVDSVVPFVHGATLALLPFRVARGIQNKALEALAGGLPLVVSDSCAEGLAGEPGRDYLAAGDTDGLVHHAVSILEDPDLRRTLAQAGRALVEREYAWDAVLERFVTRVEEVAAAPVGSAAAGAAR